MSGFGLGLDPRILMAMSGGNNSDTPEWWKGIDEEERKRREEEDKRRLARPSGMGSMDDIRQIEDPNGQIRFEGPGINIRVRNQTALDKIRVEAGKMVGLPAQSRGSYNEAPGPVAPERSTEDMARLLEYQSMTNPQSRRYNPDASNALAGVMQNAEQENRAQERFLAEGPSRDAQTKYNIGKAGWYDAQAAKQLAEEDRIRKFTALGRTENGNIPVAPNSPTSPGEMQASGRLLSLQKDASNKRSAFNTLARAIGPSPSGTSAAYVDQLRIAAEDAEARLAQEQRRLGVAPNENPVSQSGGFAERFIGQLK